MLVVFWTNRRGPRPETPRLRPRVAPTGLAKVDFTELVPEPVPFLGQAAYIQLEFFESLAKAVATAPTLPSKEGLSAAAGVALRKHHALIAELRRLGVETLAKGDQCNRARFVRICERCRPYRVGSKELDTHPVDLYDFSGMHAAPANSGFTC